MESKKVQKFCPVCLASGDQEQFDDYHKATAKHRFNWSLFEFNKRRDAVCRDRHGVTLSVTVVPLNGFAYKFTSDIDKHGCYILTMTPEEMRQNGNNVEFQCVIQNVMNQKPINLIYKGILHPCKSFSMTDPNNNEDKFLILQPGANYTVYVKLKLDETVISRFQIPICFTFQSVDDRIFSISRSIIVGIHDRIVVEESNTKSPFTHNVWEKDVTVEAARGSRGRKHSAYPIPENYRLIFKHGLKLSSDNYEVLQEIKKKLYPDVVTRDNYKDFFSILLWLEEVSCIIALGSYNMENVHLDYLPGNLLRLKVPGLAEKRPSVVVGDSIQIRIHGDHTAYEGIIIRVGDTYVDIADVNDVCLQIINACPEIEMDIRFVLGGIHFDRMHLGVDQIVRNNYVDNLFPEKSLAAIKVMEPIQIWENEFFNKNIYKNNEQRTAVLKIVNNTSSGAPYIVYGPPGTGKTMTIVEAILQIKRITKKKILICAPANAACNMLTERLARYCKKDELKRVLSQTAELESLNPSIKPYTNIIEDPDGDIIERLTGRDVSKYRIIITTLILAGKFTREYFPDIVFIDEAAQAREPEACCAIGLLFKNRQLVLAGDPQQLGPCVDSVICQEFGLNISLLERLMKLPLYTDENQNFITMLKLNYRSHNEILKLPNSIFYEDQLIAVSAIVEADLVSKVFMYQLAMNKKQTGGRAIEFCSVISKEKREGRSPSYYNPKEIQMVQKYVKALTSMPDVEVSHSEIGIVTPYIRQVYKVRDVLKTDYPEIEVGTTESFQGREKRVLIITTVRAQEDLLLFDRQYKLGFVANPKRFNVAITRAKSKLIVIGNPIVLATDEKWLQYIRMCQQFGTYGGAPFQIRTQEVRDAITSRIKGIKLNDD